MRTENKHTVLTGLRTGCWLADTGGALRVVLHRHVKGSELLLNNFEKREAKPMSAREPHEERPGTVNLADEEAVKQILVSTVFGLWDIVNNLTRLRPSRQERYRVTIFGSARAKPGTFVYSRPSRRWPTPKT